MVWCGLSIDRHIICFTYQNRFCHSWVVTACCFRSLFTVGLSSCHLSSNCTPGRLEFKSKVDIFSTFSFNQRMISWQEHSILFENLPHTVYLAGSYHTRTKPKASWGCNLFQRCSQNVTRGLGRTSISGIGLSTTQSTFQGNVFGKSETIFRKYKTKSGLICLHVAGEGVGERKSAKEEKREGSQRPQRWAKGGSYSGRPLPSLPRPLLFPPYPLPLSTPASRARDGSRPSLGWPITSYKLCETAKIAGHFFIHDWLCKIKAVWACNRNQT